VLLYLEFHPLAILWLSIVALVIVGGLWSRRRRLPSHPYPASWRTTDSAVGWPTQWSTEPLAGSSIPSPGGTPAAECASGPATGRPSADHPAGLVGSLFNPEEER
jgi:hypothetical protein